MRTEASPFKTCSCGHQFSTLESFLQKTRLVGILPTLKYMAFDLELRNCPECKSTLSRQVEKDVLIEAVG